MPIIELDREIAPRAYGGQFSIQIPPWKFIVPIIFNESLLSTDPLLSQHSLARQFDLSRRLAFLEAAFRHTNGTAFT